MCCKEVGKLIKIGHVREVELLEKMPLEVQETVLGILEILDSEYGGDRDIAHDNGGYVLILEAKEDLKEVKEKVNIDCYDAIAEYVDKVVCSDGQEYINALILCNSDYGISLIMPMEIATKNLVNQM